MSAADRNDKKRAEGEAAARTAIDKMPEPDRSIGERLHTIITENAPALSPKTWYGFPAYANTDGKIVCFFRSTQKFRERYMTLGFNDSATLDDGELWPISFALKSLDGDTESRIADIVKKAAS